MPLILADVLPGPAAAGPRQAGESGSAFEPYDLVSEHEPRTPSLFGCISGILSKRLLEMFYLGQVKIKGQEGSKSDCLLPEGTGAMIARSPGACSPASPDGQQGAGGPSGGAVLA